MIYIVVLIALLILSYHYDFLQKVKHKKLWYYIILIVLILIAGLRYRIGVDTIRYEGHFADIPTFSTLTLDDFTYTSHQPLYFILEVFAKSISDDFWVMQLLHSILVNTVLLRFFRLNTRHLFLSILLYFVFMYNSYLFETMRESAAVAMFLLGWEWIKREKWIIFVLFAILAVGFHISAILLLILPLLKILHIWEFLKVGKFTFVLLILLFVMGTVIQTQFFDYIVQLNLLESVTEKADRYAETDLAGRTLNIFGILLGTIRQIVFPYIACLLLKKENIISTNKDAMVFICFSFIVLSFTIGILYRYYNYFYPFALLVLSDAIYIPKIRITTRSYLKSQAFSFWFATILLILAIQISVSFCANIPSTSYKEYMRYYPYASVITKKLDINRESVFRYYNAN